ncbi:tetratricopeptide repeat protein [Nocardia sp. NPDC058705]|uniref:tetratricopeptide repeat protein n=1 Tax=Nocardia sp. NPDC058705 TaxID=3346609 RepID=UPI0036CF6D25
MTGWHGPVAGQSVTGIVVFGDVVQISGVSGDVVVATGRPPYRVESFSVAPAALSPSTARRQPSKLLHPRYQLVPFTARGSELDGVAAWLAAGDPVSAYMFRGPGGQGKTRLATKIVTDAQAAGWAVWRVTNTPAWTGESRSTLTGQQGVLVVVDYADRWQPTDLLGLVADMNALSLRTGLVVRVLMLARSAGYWWTAVSDRIDSEFNIDSHTHHLLPLGEQIDRHELFYDAAKSFGSALEVPSNNVDAEVFDLDSPPFATVLSIHMAALVSVDMSSPAAIPTDPHALSAHLLKRERAHWFFLHARPEGRRGTPPEVMNRAVVTSTLTGSLPRLDARAALAAVGLADSQHRADSIIDDHTYCYPATETHSVFDPLQPDRLGEDLIGLSTPGHTFAEWQPDDWSISAPESLVSSGTKAPIWTSHAVTVLVETAHRWPHILTEVLYPLVRHHPHRVISAGGQTLTRIAEIPDIELEILEILDDNLPNGPHVELDLAAAVFSTALLERRLATRTDDEPLAKLFNKHILRLYRAGKYAEAADAAAQIVSSCRDAYENHASDNNAFELKLSLNNYAIVLHLSGQTSRAVEVSADEVRLARRLATRQPVTLPDLAAALDNHSTFLSEAGRDEDSIPGSIEAVEIYRSLAGGTADVADAEQVLADLARALDNHGRRLKSVGQSAETAPLIKEAVEIFEGLAAREPATYLPDYALAQNNLGNALIRAGLQDEALVYTQRAVALYRDLARANPDAHLVGLAMSLANHSHALAESEAHGLALDMQFEAVEIRRKLALDRPSAQLGDYAMSLNNLGMRLRDVRRHDDAVASGEESVALFEQLVKSMYEAHIASLAMARNNLAIHLSETGRGRDALPLAESALAIRASLASKSPAVYQDAVRDSQNTLAFIRTKLTEK